MGVISIVIGIINQLITGGAPPWRVTSIPILSRSILRVAGSEEDIAEDFLVPGMNWGKPQLRRVCWSRCQKLVFFCCSNSRYTCAEGGVERRRAQAEAAKLANCRQVNFSVPRGVSNSNVSSGSLPLNQSVACGQGLKRQWSLQNPQDVVGFPLGKAEKKHPQMLHGAGIFTYIYPQKNHPSSCR